MNRIDQKKTMKDEGSTRRPGKAWSKVMWRTLHQMMVMFPVLAGVILLVGLFQTFVPKTLLTSLFTGQLVLDALVGAVSGSVLTGNPVNSYVIGKGLLDVNVGLAGVSAFILTWVTVGVVQLPAEISALGLRFALVRTAAAFALSIPIACLTVWLMGVVV